MIKNMVGFEAEVFIEKDGELVIPSKFGLPTDQFELLGEIRGLPGSTPAETLSNFMKEYYDFMLKARKSGLSLSLAGGHKISHSLYAEVIKLMGAKEWPESKNIYGTDITETSDVVLDPETGKIVGHNVSAGLHVHFSSGDRQTVEERYVDHDVYSPVKLPIALGTGVTASIELFSRTHTATPNKDIAKALVTASASRITKPVISYIVKAMDDVILFKHGTSPVMTKYRQPGFYEIKPWGFEYRSLPFTQGVLDHLFEIAEFSFNLLESL